MILLWYSINYTQFLKKILKKGLPEMVGSFFLNSSFLFFFLYSMKKKGIIQRDLYEKIYNFGGDAIVFAGAAFS